MPVWPSKWWSVRVLIDLSGTMPPATCVEGSFHSSKQLSITPEVASFTVVSRSALKPVRPGKHERPHRAVRRDAGTVDCLRSG